MRRLALALLLFAGAAAAEPTGTFLPLHGGTLQGNLYIKNSKSLDITGGGAYSSSGFFRTPLGSQLTGLWFNSATPSIMSAGTVLGYFDAATGRMFENYGVTSLGDVLATSYLRSTGVATSSLPTCAVGIAGSIEFDTTVRRLVVCDNNTGSYAWRYLLTTNNTTQVSVIETSSFTAINFGTASADTNFAGSYYVSTSSASPGTAVDSIMRAAYLTCHNGTAGAVGGATRGLDMQIWDNTSASELCSCSLGTAACSAGVSAPYDCTCGGGFTPAHYVTVRVKSTTDCGTKPGNIVCNVELFRTLSGFNQP